MVYYTGTTATVITDDPDLNPGHYMMGYAHAITTRWREPRKIGTTTTTTTAGQAPTQQPKWQVAAEFIKCPGELH